MKILGAFTLAALATVAAGCNSADTTATNGNANANAIVANQTTTRTGPDNSEITTTTDANGVTTETRVFRGNPRVSRVVVTTRSGNRSVRAYSASGEEKEVNDVGDALEATGDKIAQAAGWTADKAEDVPGEVKKGVNEVGDKAEDVADKTADGAKKVGKKTAEGAKKVGNKIKDAVTP